MGQYENVWSTQIQCTQHQRHALIFFSSHSKMTANFAISRIFNAIQYSAKGMRNEYSWRWLNLVLCCNSPAKLERCVKTKFAFFQFYMQTLKNACYVLHFIDYSICNEILLYRLFVATNIPNMCGLFLFDIWKNKIIDAWNAYRILTVAVKRRWYIICSL